VAYDHYQIPTNEGIIMTRQDAIQIVVKLQNRTENRGTDIVTFCGFCDSVEEILNHARNNGWEG